MKIYSWNVNGLRSVIKKNFFDFLNKEKPDILCLQESKMTAEQFKDLPEITQYKLVESSAQHKKGYSGVVVLLKKSLEKDFKFISSGIGIKAYDDEGRFLIFQYQGLTIYNIYFPSGTSGDHRQNFKYKFLDDFLSHLKHLPKKVAEKLIICGDFNICHKEIDIHHPEIASKRKLTGFLPEERQWMDKFVASGYIDTFRFFQPTKDKQYTWWSQRANSRAKNLGWRIDYFFLSEKLKDRLKSAGILQKVAGSDHCPIFCEINTP